MTAALAESPHLPDDLRDAMARAAAGTDLVFALGESAPLATRIAAVLAAPPARPSWADTQGSDTQLAELAWHPECTPVEFVALGSAARWDGCA